MSGLVIKLAPKERVLINGAVVENGDRRTKLQIMSPNAAVLRMKDAIHPDEARTPVSRLCYAVQLGLLGEVEAQSTITKGLPRIEELSQVFTDSDSRALLAAASSALVEGNFYRCLKSLKLLLPREERLLALQGA